MIKKTKVTSIFFRHEGLEEIVLISVFCHCYFYFRIYSVQFTDMYPFAEYEKSECASKFNLLIINAMFP